MSQWSVMEWGECAILQNEMREMAAPFGKLEGEFVKKIVQL